MRRRRATQIRIANKHLKSGKSFGADNITTEMFRADLNLSTYFLSTTFGIHQKWESEKNVIRIAAETGIV